MKKAAFCLLVLLCLLLSVNGTSMTLFVGCTSSPLCLSEPVSYMCSGENGAGLDDDVLRWGIRDSSRSSNDNIPNGTTAYVERTDVSTPRIIGTYFETILTSSADPMRSNISFSPVLAINNYTILCDIIGTTPFGCSIIIADVLAAPVSSDIKFTSDTLVFSWTPQSTSPCLSHYSVNVTSIEYTINTTNTSLSLPVHLTNDTEYSISVVAVDTAGRYMDPTSKIIFIADVPGPVTDLVINWTGFDIYVTWNYPPYFVSPYVSSYIVYPSDHYTGITIPAPTTTYNIPDVTVRSVYTVGVAAVNALGTGPTASATISIICTFVPTRSITSFSVTPTVVTNRGKLMVLKST
uniref:Fibronectin type-III domain-containing protein n=1 Tax=Amphimedon queenslandica TaxID=400682 RepID=A0A1X7TZH4_AMPQE